MQNHRLSLRSLTIVRSSTDGVFKNKVGENGWQKMILAELQSLRVFCCLEDVVDGENLN